MKIKLLHVITGLGNGGAEKVLFDLITNSNNNNFEHVVISLSDTGYYGVRLNNVGIKVYYLHLSKFNLIMKIVILLKIINIERPNIVHGWMYLGNLFTLCARLTKYKTIVWGVHSSTVNKMLSSVSVRLSNCICAMLSKLPEVIIFVGHKPMENHKLYGYHSAKMTVINNGYDLGLLYPNTLAGATIRKELNLSSDQMIVGCVGRFHPVKDHDNLLSAMNYIKQKRDNLVVIMVGNYINSHNKHLIDIIEQNNLSKNVILAGARNDMPSVYNALDFLVLSSKSEAFPNVVAEAMACGKPCVVTDVGDAAYMVGDTGIVVPAENSRALANGIMKMLDYGQEDIKKLGALARLRAEQKFSLGNMVARYEELYLTIFNKSQID